MTFWLTSHAGVAPRSDPSRTPQQLRDRRLVAGVHPRARPAARGLGGVAGLAAAVRAPAGGRLIAVDRARVGVADRDRADAGRQHLDADRDVRVGPVAVAELAVAALAPAADRA